MKFLTSPDEYTRIANRQRQYYERLAQKIESCEALTNLERDQVAGILRAYAQQIPDKAPRKPGRAPKIDAATVAGEFAILVNLRGMKKTPAIEHLAERHHVTTEAVKKAIDKHGAEALRLFSKKT